MKIKPFFTFLAIVGLIRSTSTALVEVSASEEAKIKKNHHWNGNVHSENGNWIVAWYTACI